MEIEEAFRHLAGSRTLRSSSVDRYRRSLRGLQRVGIVTLADCTGPRVAAALDERLKTVGVGTANNELVALVSTLRWVARRDPALLARLAELEALRLPEPEAQPPETWTPLEWQTVEAAAARIAPWLPLACAITTLAGLRRNEARTICREDVILDEKVLLVVRRRDRELKTGSSSQREVSLCPRLLEILRDANLPESGPIFPARTAASTQPYVSMETWKRAMRKLSRETGLHATWTRGRRSFITWAIKSGVPQPDVERAAGHVDGEMIRRHYYGWRRGYVPAFERLKPSG
jgi:integrase